jgi:hypothetical protein
MLHLRFRSHGEMDAVEAATFLDDQQTISGFQRLATLFAIPKALFIWSAILFCIQIAATLFALLPEPYVYLVAAALGGVACAIFKAAFPEYQIPSPPRLIRKQKSADELV